ncbi:chorismate dehydratase [Verrucomicrobium sp. GAS474]|uniref:menaquinone biosynthesis protein n=1 Tax=Verrucomicrobium sp. GAS474 TaxID=1882831 RepID=UPI00087A4227|nr:menaquinone biosynthesis protein [Verrucomicrobium sp. GAS474]SDT86599.1 chorismate dehydratase [Verrucomicrobium sp. GAS474]
MAAPRLGSVPYRNVAALIEGLDPAPTTLVPARLAEELAAGRLDAALVPIAEYLRDPAAYALVDDVAVASRGEVYSVILIPDWPPQNEGEGNGLEVLRPLWTISLDPDSRTSVLLTRVLAEIGCGTRPKYVGPYEDADARLLIGDPAIRFRQENPDRAVIDLGLLWKRWTGLPFVYAAWVVRREVAERQPELGPFLRGVKERGLAALPRIARDEAELRYLTENIHPHLGDEEKAGLLLFARYARSLPGTPLPAEEPTPVWI